MKHIFTTIAFAFLITMVNAQTKDTLKINPEEEAIPKIFVNATSDEADNEGQDISGLLQSSKDIFVSTAGYTFGTTRFKIRGFDSENMTVMMNGIPVNDMETGRAYWSSWGGLNDATRNKEISIGISPSNYTFGGVGGTTNMITRASSFRKGVKLTYSSTNRSYRNRLMVTAATGMQDNGWAFTVSASRRWAQEGYVEGTFYDAWGYFLSAEKKINEHHSIGLIGYGAPTLRGKNGVSVQEALDYAGTNYYNPYWGYQNGEKRNSRVSNYHQPMIMLTDYWKIDSKTTLNTSVYYWFGPGGSTALDWYDRDDPRPDYYKNLPSYDRDYNGYTQDERKYLWENDPSFRQLNFDKFYNDNRKNLYTVDNVEGIPGNSYTGNLSAYILENRRNDKKQWGFNSDLNKEVNEHFTLSAGLNLSWYKVNQYKIVDDLLGGDYYINWDKYAIRDFSLSDSTKIQNDLNHPNGIVKEGDRFGYDYVANVNNYELFGQGDFTYAKIDFYVGAKIGFNQFWRTGNMRNGKFPNSSYGDSEKNNFTNAGIKAGITYKITGRHFITANGFFMTRAPYFRTAYVSPRTRDQVVSGLTNEKILSGDLSYIYRSPYITSRLTGYYAKFMDQAYSKSYYHDILRSFVNYNMVGVDKVHYGLEASIEAKVSQNFTLFGVAALGNYLYASDPVATISADNVAKVISNRKVYFEGYKVGGFPQTALSGGVKYFSSRYIFAGFNVNYFDNAYLEANPDRRTQEAVKNFGPEYPERDVILEQERLSSAYTIDAYIGKSWRISHKYYLSLNFSVSNILNNTDFAFGGFEQFRYNPLDINKFPPKYFYLYGRQYYANISLRF